MKRGSWWDGVSTLWTSNVASVNIKWFKTTHNNQCYLAYLGITAENPKRILRKYMTLYLHVLKNPITIWILLHFILTRNISHSPISDETAHMCRQKGKNSCTAVSVPILFIICSVKGLCFCFQEQKTEPA